MNSSINKQKGFSLLELLLVVGVGALLLLAGLATYRLVTEGNNVNEAIRLINTIKNQTQNVFQNQGSYDVGSDGDSLVDVLVAANAFPAGTLNANDVPQDPWGQPITVTQINDEGDQFQIGMTNVPQSACLRLGMAFDPTTDLDVSQAVIESATFDSGTAPDIATLSDTTSGCTTGANNTLAWDFY